MSTVPIADLPQPEAALHEATAGPLLICLPWLAADALAPMTECIAAALPDQSVCLAVPSPALESDPDSDITLVAYSAAPTTHAGWALTASDYLAAAELTRQHGASATLLLGAESTSLSPETLQALAAPVLRGNVDLTLPRYRTGPHDGLLSSALLFPLTFALFGVEAHLPLPLDAAFSPRLAARLEVRARRPNPGAESASLLWPVAEAATASFVVREIDAGSRTLPHYADADLQSLLSQLAGSLFSEIETTATFWQRARPSVTPPPRVAPARSTDAPDPSTSAADDADIAALVEDFRNAFRNLQEIWAIVLPPQSLLALKKVSLASGDAFDLPTSLWARTVYDFVLAWRLRTINRGHLLGAFTPLYLAWVASHLRRSAGDAAQAAFHVEQTADAFRAEKAYILARWRWPDRFNP